MSQHASDEAAVLAAADAIVDAFAAHDAERYFSLFDPDTSFVFYTAPERLNTVAKYRALWAEWERESGFRVHGCRSSERRVQLWGDTAVFTHSVSSDIEFSGEVSTVLERETMVFVRRGSDWVAVHEHLSPLSNDS